MTDDKTPLLCRVVKASAASLLCSASDKFVLLSLVEAFNPERNGALIWPGQDTLVEQTGLARRTVQRCLQNLCDSDLIKRHKSTGRHNVYALNVGLIHRLLSMRHSDASEGADASQRRSRCVVVAQQMRHHGALTTKGTTKRTTNNSFVRGSSNLKGNSDPPVQRLLPIHQVIAPAVDRLRSNRPEPRTENKPRDGPRAAQDRPGERPQKNRK